MRTMHLFAGVGGGLLADIILGHTPIAAIENDPYCCQVLRERAEDGWFPGLEVIEADVRTVEFTRWRGGVDCISAGFPCQDISVAGRGDGISGARSGLYREVIRAVDAVRPRFVFIENSPNIRTKGRHIVIGDLVALGYSWRDGMLAASDVGAPHGRRRWWCLAAHSLCKREQGEQPTVPHAQERQIEDPGQTGSFCDGDGWWASEPGVVRMVHGVPDRAHRIKGLGNAQVPLQAAVAWKLLGGP